mmetsp:Transcript_21916/g.39766  ORF Transcript_21916/g.39766 Transcript_21916/m.39766 type:complete len:196 (+) Transcript_21916:70-657(+)
MPSFDEIRSSVSGSLQKAGSRVGLASVSTDEEEQKHPDRLDELSEICPKLTFQQRMLGFAICFGSGYLITFLSFSFFIQLMEGDPLPFVIVYTSGNILSLLSSMFLCGPKRQFKNMFDEKRRETSIVYLSCLLVTVIVVFIPIPVAYSAVKLLLLVLLLIAQFCASLWYTLSYIPYGRRTFLRMIKGAFGIEDEG